MKRFFASMLAGLVALLGCAPADAQDQAPPRVNVILMLADDLATQDLSCYGSQRIKTPRLDALAGQGLRLTSYYAGASVCSPSRMALLSGSYPARLGWRWGVQGYGFAPGTGMSPDVYTMAEAFRDAGYRTAMVGKWHIGEANMSPEHQGFDSTYYIAMSNNQNRDMLRDGKLVQKDWDNRTLTQTFAQEAIRVISEDSDKPFFLYLPWTAPHFPAVPHPDWQGKSGDDKNGRYIDTVQELDTRVGEILDALDKAGKADNTIVVFTSDNGREGSQAVKNDQPPYSGQKWQSREGGTRVPCIVRWPGSIETGVSDKMLAAIDLYPTLAYICKVKVDLPVDAQNMDGKIVWPLSSSWELGYASARTELLYWHGKGQATAIRVGDWKLYFNAGDGDPDVTQGVVLYNLQDDLKESHNVAPDHPEQVQAMLARAKSMLIDIYTRQTPLGVLDGGQAPEKPLQAQEVWGKWLN